MHAVIFLRVESVACVRYARLTEYICLPGAMEELDILTICTCPSLNVTNTWNVSTLLCLQTPMSSANTSLGLSS